MGVKRQFFIRVGPPDTGFIEDSPTWIVLGRWTHLYNEGTEEWFLATDRPSNPHESLSRGVGSMREVDEPTFIRRFGWEGRKRLIVDRLGLSWPYLLVKWHLGLGLFRYFDRWLRRLRIRRHKSFVGETEPMKKYLEDFCANGDIHKD